jgi:hypothetical protein
VWERLVSSNLLRNKMISMMMTSSNKFKISIERNAKEKLSRTQRLSNQWSLGLNNRKTRIQVLGPITTEKRITGIKELTIFFLLIFDLFINND